MLECGDSVTINCFHWQSVAIVHMQTYTIWSKVSERRVFNSLPLEIRNDKKSVFFLQRVCFNFFQK